MRRTFLNTAAIILVAVIWLACAPVGGFPTPGRRILTEPSSARRHDDLIAGSDFLDMFIGTTVSPSVRSRRYPISRSVIDQNPRSHFERRFQSGSMPHNRLPSPHHNAETQKSFIENQDQTGRISSDSSFLNEPNRHYGTRSQHKNTISHTENRQRKVEIVSSPTEYTSPNEGIRVSAETSIDNVMDSENQVFGRRTIPRTSRISMSTSSTREASVPKESLTNSFAYEVHDESQKIIPNLKEVPTVNHEIINDVNSEDQHHIFDKEVTVPGDIKVLDRSFSVSSSVQKFVPKREHMLRERKFKRTQSPNLESDEFAAKSPFLQVVSTDEIPQTKSPESEFTVSGTPEPTTLYDSYSTVIEETSTIPTLFDTETSPTEINDDWTTKSEISFSEDTDKTNLRHNTETPKPYDSHEDTTVQVVSVKVTSSVERSQSTPQSHYTQPTINTDTREVHSSVIDSLDYDDVLTSRIAKSKTASLVTEEQPPATSIQRSDFNVEESSPTEVTANPQTGFPSYFSSSFQSPTTQYYQPSSVETFSDHQNVPSNPGSRVQFFSKSPSYRRGLSFAPIRKEGLDSGSIEASVVESNRRSYSVQPLPRISVERSSASISQTLSKEPVIVAESIQRSVISAQAAKTTSDRERYQNKVKFGFGRLRNFEDEKYTDKPLTTDNSGQNSDSFILGQSTQNTYNQYDKVYAEPEKVYSEPEKIYGEPEKVYGEPEKRYDEPTKAYGESSKNYGVPEQNYEVDEAVSVETNGRAHGVQRPVPSQVTQPPMTHVDTALKVFDTRQQDPNHKFGYVVEGRDFRKYRVEERTSDGFIVGEYGVVSNDGGNLRGVRYTADGTINPRLIYDTLLKFLSL